VALLVFPSDIFPTECDWRLVPRTQVFSNPFNGSVQTLSLPGAYWQVQLSFANLSRDHAARLHALITQLRGPSGRIQLWDHAFATPRGAAGGNPTINGAGQVGGLLNIKGCTPSSVFLKTGDYCQIGLQRVMVTADAIANATGLCTLQVEAPIRYAPANGSAIIVNKASAVMMLKDDDQGGRRSSKKLVLSSLSLTFFEDVNT
jgi:hypothetical protein